VDDADVEAVDQHQNGGSGVGSAHPDVVEPAVVAEGEFAVVVDDVAPDSVCGSAGVEAAGLALGRAW
jgi:hypothetical protein